MFCTSCGKNIPDDSVFCPECGASIGNEAPVKKVSAAPANGNLWICALVGAALIFIAPFLPWVTLSVSFMGASVSESTNLFGMTGLDTFAAILLLLFGAFLICWSLGAKVPAIQNIKNKLAVIPFLELIVIGVVLIITIIAMIRKGGAAAELDDMGGMFEDAMSISAGIGAWICLIACIVAAVPSVLGIVNKNK